MGASGFCATRVGVGSKGNRRESAHLRVLLLTLPPTNVPPIGFVCQEASDRCHICGRERNEKGGNGKVKGGTTVGGGKTSSKKESKALIQMGSSSSPLVAERDTTPLVERDIR